jgi:hypothetical protein
VTVVDRALAVPLTQRHAECYTKPGFALVAMRRTASIRWQDRG